MRRAGWLACCAVLIRADDGAPRARTPKGEPNPPAWPAMVHVLAPARCAELSRVNAGAAVLLEPGTYACDVALPPRSSVAGLGSSPRDVALKRSSGEEAALAENLRVEGDSRGPRVLRRVVIGGDLSRSEYVADANVTGGARLGAARAWAARSSALGSEVDAVAVDARGWFSAKRDPAQISGGGVNVVLVGVSNSPNASVPRGAAPGAAYAVSREAPRVQDKPYVIREGRDYFLVRPRPRLFARGCCANASDRIPFTSVHVARPGAVDLIREKLLSGLHVVLTPGTYELEDGLELNFDHQIVLGLGEVVLRAPRDGEPAARARGMNAVLAGVIIEGVQYPRGDTALVRWEGSRGVLADVSIVVGDGASCRTGVAVQADAVVLDHVSVERTTGSINVGISVDGADVVAYALRVVAVEADGIRWRGENGAAYGVDVDLPRDAGTDFQNGGYVGYAVGDFVQRHEAVGLAVYAEFEGDVRVRTAVRRSASPNVTLHSVASVFVAGRGVILSVVNGDGAAVGPAGNALARHP
jgi:hypothetical protein